MSVDLNNWLELQEQAKLHDNQMKELVASHVEDQQRSVPVENGAGKWGPPKMELNKQVNKLVPSHHDPAHSPKKEYGLGVKNQATTMDMLKRSDMWIADSGASNHVTFSDKGFRNKRIATGLTWNCGRLSATQCELDIPYVHFVKDRAQVGEVIITDVSHLPKDNFNLFSMTRLQKKGWTLTENADYIKLEKGKKSLLFNMVINTPKGALYVSKFSRKEGDYNIKKAHELLGHNHENDTRQMASHLG